MRPLGACRGNYVDVEQNPYQPIVVNGIVIFDVVAHVFGPLSGLLLDCLHNEHGITVAVVGEGRGDVERLPLLEAARVLEVSYPIWHKKVRNADQEGRTNGQRKVSRKKKPLGLGEFPRQIVSVP